MVGDKSERGRGQVTEGPVGKIWPLGFILSVKEALKERNDGYDLLKKK